MTQQEGRSGTRSFRDIVYRRAAHPVGLAVALFFFAQSMTPSLLPRVWYLQGVATGISVATGYGLGCLVAWILRRCGVHPQWSAETRRRGWWVLAAVAVVVIPTFLILGSWWQQIVRELVGLERLERLLYLPVLLVAAAVALVLIAVARLLRFGVEWLSAFSARFLPGGVAKVAAVVVVVLLLVVVLDHGVYRGILSVAEGSAAASDHGTANGVNRPSAPERSGSPDSLEDWDTLGREGRTFVAGGPTADEISDATGEPALTPIRAYVGKESADTVAEGAEKVVAELERTGAFDRSVLAVVTTTGRGWVNENVAGAFEFVSGGDSAIAAMQYSFLPSPLAFLADRETPQDAGRALFDAVYERWDELPEDARPKLVVFGESLGSYGGQAAFASGDALVELTDGALLVGTPNFAEPWGRITEGRDEGTFERLPVVDGGRNIRFASVPGDADLPAEWELPRVVFWQHASDPITWWSFDLILHKPDWLREPLGPDVDPGMRWIPFVTFWQVTLDMVFSAEVPDGHGHSYGVDAADLWVDILTPQGWDSDDTIRVQEALSGRSQTAELEATGE
ncbi:MAG TPA: alpha/beta hydrolase [Rhodococcus sp. (in: high G+C Gram-positive bacteria)]|nr:alpha/beta hydrolase [Rhodococcus sp. (in: high G+C Gram-positive bacteria)]